MSVPVLAVLGAGCTAAGFPRGEIVDLSHAFGADTIYWPTAEDFVLEEDFKGTTDGGYHYEANTFRGAEHGGTHLDAPVHFARGMQAADQVPLDRLIGPGIVVDVETACARDRDYEVGVEDLLAWEREHGRIPDAARWLVENRATGAIGLDTPSIDHGQSARFESHRILFAANVPALENVARLERLPAAGFHVVALPMKIRGGSGGPLRIVAILP